MQKNNYSALALWGQEKLNIVTSLDRQASNLYHTQHVEKILESGRLYLQAANTALAYTGEINDTHARDFLLNAKILELYARAVACFYKFITDPQYHISQELNIGVFESFLDIITKDSALVLLVGKMDAHQSNICCIDDVNNILKNKYPEQSAGLFIEAAKKAIRSNFPALISLALYNFALANLHDRFYNIPEPGDDVIEQYRSTMEAAIDIAAGLSITEQGGKEFAIKQQQMREMIKRLNFLREKEAAYIKTSYAGKRQEPLPSTLRKRRPTPSGL